MPSLVWILMALILATSVARAEDSLGRLFLTPQERQQMDILRDPNAKHPATDPGDALAGAATVDPTTVLNGVVRRSHGPDVVWVNGVRAGTASGQTMHLRRGPDNNNRVTLEDADGAVARLKPGQVWDASTGRVADCFGCTKGHNTTDLVAPPEPVAEAPATTRAEAPAAASPATQP